MMKMIKTNQKREEGIMKLNAGILCVGGCIAVAVMMGGCATPEPEPVVIAPQVNTDNLAAKVIIPPEGSPGPVKPVINKNDPIEVVAFARNLSYAGRNKESALIYLDAAKRFQSVNRRFENDCRKAAVREYWLAGMFGDSANLLDALEKEQDIYGYASESDNLRRLRALLNAGEAYKE
jgi:hypothetical protein